MISPNKLIILIDCPVADMTPKVAIKQIGIPKRTHKATDALRKTNRISATINKPPIALYSSKFILSSRRSVAESYLSNDNPAGSFLFVSNKKSSTLDARTSASESSARIRCNSIAGEFRRKATASVSLKSSVTRAISER